MAGVTTSTWDLVKTIESDDENVPNYDSSSESEQEMQPKQMKKSDAIKKKTKKSDEFNNEFEFVGTVGEYNLDPWKSDVQKYIKRKASTKTDDKIARIREGKGIYVPLQLQHIAILAKC